MDQLTLPPESPIAMLPQNLARPFRDDTAPASGPDRQATILRVTVFAVVIALTAAFGREMIDILAKGGLSVLELVMAVSFITSFVWIALAAVNAMAGTVMIASGFGPRMVRARPKPPTPLTVALLVPVHNETPERIFGNAVAMLTALARHPTCHRFSLFILSDTTDPTIAAVERGALDLAARRLPAGCRLHYRHRDSNVGRKAGNVAEWCRRWGGAHDAFVVLDADSLMSENAIVALADALGGDPSAGLVQSVPRLINARTLFGRMQQFATAAYGPLLAAGLALWSRGEGNYWGHNAIIRTRAFAACAGLPRLPGRKPFGGMVMSHDFVEAALLRRAGWRVRLLPQITGSFEETPPTIADSVLRDRRWCQGNLQHLGVVGAAGLHPVSRFHLFQGVMAYVSSLMWMLFLIAGTAVAMRAGAMPVDYFPEPHVLFPSWPIIDWERAMTLLVMTVGVLLTPKLLAVALVGAQREAWSQWGGLRSFVTSAAAEIVLSAAIAPILMVQQTLAVLRSLAGAEAGWAPQRRSAGQVSWPALVRFHAAETVLGIGLCAGMALAVVPLWLMPIAASLVAAVPMSAVTGTVIGRRHILWPLFAVPERLDPPDVLIAAHAHGAALRLRPAWAPGEAEAEAA